MKWEAKSCTDWHQTAKKLLDFCFLFQWQYSNKKTQPETVLNDNPRLADHPFHERLIISWILVKQTKQTRFIKWQLQSLHWAYWGRSTVSKVEKFCSSTKRFMMEEGTIAAQNSSQNICLFSMQISYYCFHHDLSYCISMMDSNQY